MNPTQKLSLDLTEADRYHLTEAGRRYLDETAFAALCEKPDACRFCGRPGCYPVCEVSANGVQNCGLEQGDEPGSVPDVLRSAARYLDRHGWCQGAYFDASSGGFLPPACVVGAIGMVCYGGPVDAPAQMFDHEGFAEFEAAVLHLDRYLLVEDGTEAYEFNDAKGRTVEDVVHALRQAAATPEHELIDALKAIDDANRQLADSGLSTEQVVALLRSGGNPETAGCAPGCWCDCTSPGAPFCSDLCSSATRAKPEWCGHCVSQHRSIETNEDTSARLDGGDAR